MSETQLIVIATALAIFLFYFLLHFLKQKDHKIENSASKSEMKEIKDKLDDLSTKVTELTTQIKLISSDFGSCKSSKVFRADIERIIRDHFEGQK